jgi:hypothetical protein
VVHHSERLPLRGTFFIRQAKNFVSLSTCCGVVPAADMGTRCVGQRIHQRGGLADLARMLEGVVNICERGLWVAEQPQGQ